MALYINKQTEAEKDQFLLDCFWDTGAIGELVDSSYTILSGRKGIGKSAIARYLEKNTQEYGVSFAYRLSIRNFNTLKNKDEKDVLDSILSYIIVRTVKKMLETKYFDEKALSYWKDFLLSNGLQQVSDYESFVSSKQSRKKGFSIKAIASYLFVKGEGATELEDEVTKEKAKISDSPLALYEALRQSFSSDDRIIIFVDDISDHLDESDKGGLKKDINIIKDLLLSLQAINLNFIESDLNVRFVSLVREDLFEFMEGSNINKLKSDSLELVWSEKDFAALILKRMPQFKNRANDLKEPVKIIKEWFPDSIFGDLLKNFSTNRYGSNFYAYMAAISFNRPRDFLQFCYALRNRLSTKHPATAENIESAEIEYSDYFIQELRDELYIASRVFDYDFSQEKIDRLIDIMSKKESFNSPELKAELSKFIGEKTSTGHKKIELLIKELWRYGVIGVTEKQDNIIRFKYLSESVVFTSEKIKNYVYFLHRGLWWFAKKRRNK